MWECNWVWFAGIEARGFVFGSSVALGIGAKFVPLRKPRKLPGIFFCFVLFMLSVVLVELASKLESL